MWLRDVDGLRSEISRIEELLRSSILDDEIEDALRKELRSAREELGTLEARLWTQLQR